MEDVPSLTTLIEMHCKQQDDDDNGDDGMWLFGALLSTSFRCCYVEVAVVEKVAFVYCLNRASSCGIV